MCPTLMASHTPNSTTSMNEKTLTLDSSISQDRYPGFPKTVSPIASTLDESGAAAQPLGSTIPPNHDHRTLILCFDGTGM